MRNVPPLSAVLPDIGGVKLRPIPLSVSAQYQVCVDAGVSAAAGFFDDLAAVGLHDHIACSVAVFTEAVRAGLAKDGVSSQERMQACIDAFAAGYLGRIHQELRLFHGEAAGHGQATGADRSPHQSTKMH